jgi:hypothetical protein
MKLVKREDGWWITEVPDCDDCGPYGTKAEADDDRRGLDRYFKYGHLRSFVTSEKR